MAVYLEENQDVWWEISKEPQIHDTISVWSPKGVSENEISPTP